MDENEEFEDIKKVTKELRITSTFVDGQRLCAVVNNSGTKQDIVKMFYVDSVLLEKGIMDSLKKDA